MTEVLVSVDEPVARSPDRDRILNVKGVPPR